MSLDVDIRGLVLGFFEIIESTIFGKDGLYKISIPSKYQNFFKTKELLITFDSDIASKYNCELIIIGSKTLSLIIDNCCKKGPIVLKRTNIASNNYAIRYHFFVSFSGISSISKLIHIDIDCNSLKPVKINADLEDGSFSLNNVLDSKKFIIVYDTALDEIKNQCLSMKNKFMNNENSLFQNEFELFVSKYNLQIRELDQTINKKEAILDDLDKAKEFRFKILDQIKSIEHERDKLMDILQEKYKIILNYNLVACQIIQY